MKPITAFKITLVFSSILAAFGVVGIICGVDKTISWGSIILSFVIRIEGRQYIIEDRINQMITNYYIDIALYAKRKKEEEEDEH